jgi:hypothetical protein
MPNYIVLKKSTFYAGISIFNILPISVTILKNEKVKLQAALRQYLHTHRFYSVDNFFMCKDDLLYCFCKMYVVFYILNFCIYFFVFMTCSTSYCLNDTHMDPRNVCMYVCKIRSNTTTTCPQKHKKAVTSVSVITYPKEMCCLYSCNSARRGHIFLVFFYRYNSIYILNG